VCGHVREQCARGRVREETRGERLGPRDRSPGHLHGGHPDLPRAAGGAALERADSFVARRRVAVRVAVELVERQLPGALLERPPRSARRQREPVVARAFEVRDDVLRHDVHHVDLARVQLVPVDHVAHGGNRVRARRVRACVRSARSGSAVGACVPGPSVDRGLRLEPSAFHDAPHEREGQDGGDDPRAVHLPAVQHTACHQGVRRNGAEIRLVASAPAERRGLTSRARARSTPA
jgi:hypothetical protein